MTLVKIHREKIRERQRGWRAGTGTQVVFKSTLRLSSSISLYSVPFRSKRVTEREGELQIHTSCGLHPLFILKYPSLSTQALFLLSYKPLLRCRSVQYVSPPCLWCLLKEKSPLLCLCPLWCVQKKKKKRKTICSAFLLCPDKPVS